jgi:hypothetical protein
MAKGKIKTDDSSSGAITIELPTENDSSIIDSIVGETTDNMPTPNEGAINEHKEEKEKQEQINNELFDSKGIGFDPSIHKVDSTGSPVLTLTGKLTRKPGRKQASKLNIPSQAQTPAQSPENLEAKQSAVITVDCLLTFSQMFGGKDFAPRVDEKTGMDERVIMSGAFEKYYQAKGIGDIPPGVLLTVTLVGYFGPRFFLPETKSKLQKIKEFISYKFSKKKKGEKIAQSDIGDNGVGKNSFSERTSEGVPIQKL